MITASTWSTPASGLASVSRMSWMYAGGGAFIDPNNPGNPAAFLRTLEDGTGSAGSDGLRANPGLPSLAPGMRVLFLWYYGNGLYNHTGDAGLPWADRGAEAIRQHFSTLLSLLSDDDVPIDAVIIDNEEWGKFTTFDPNYPIIRPRIIADARGAAWGDGSNSQRWNGQAAANHATLLNRCIRDPLAQFYPAATLAGYDGYRMDPAEAVPDNNGYVLPVSSVVGNFSAPVAYNVSHGQYPNNTLGGILQDVNFCRAIKRSSPARIVPFVTPGPAMAETVRHIATLGVDRFIYFNAAGGDGSELQTVLDEVNGQLTNVNTYGADLARIDPGAGSVVSSVIQRDGSVLRRRTGADGNGSWDVTFPDPPPGGSGGGGGSGGNGSPPTPGRKLQSKMVDGVRRLVKTAAGFLAAGCNCCAVGDRCLEVYRTTECYTPFGCEAAPRGYVCADLVDRLFADNHRACVIREVGGNAVDRCYTVDRTRRYNRLTLPRERTVDGRLEQPEVLGNRNNGTVPIRCVTACNDPACITTDPAPPNGGERTFLRAVPCDPTVTTAYWVDATTVRPGCKVVPLEGPGGLCGTIRCADLPTPESQIPPDNRVLLGVDPLAPAYSSCCECQYVNCGAGQQGGGAAVCPQPFVVPCGGPGQPAGLTCCCGALIGPGATLRYFRRLSAVYHEPGGSTLTIESNWSGSCTLQSDGSLVGLIHFRQVLTDSTNPDPIITENDLQSPPVCPMYPNVLGIAGWQHDAQLCLDRGGTVNTSQSCTQLYLLAQVTGGTGDPSSEYLVSMRDNIVCTLIPRPNPGCVGGCGSAAGSGTPTSLPAGVPDDGGPVTPLPQGQNQIPALPQDDLP